MARAFSFGETRPRSAYRSPYSPASAESPRIGRWLPPIGLRRQMLPMRISAAPGTIRTIAAGRICGKQGVDGNAQYLRQPGQQGDVGRGDAALPFGHSLPRHVQPFAEGFLRKSRLDATGSDVFTNLHDIRSLRLMSAFIVSSFGQKEQGLFVDSPCFHMVDKPPPVFSILLRMFIFSAA